LLAPSIGTLPPRVAEFFQASLALYPAYLARLQAADPSLHLITGLLEIARDASRAMELTSTQVASLEPSLHAPYGARMHAHDGAIDIGRLIRALRRAVSEQPAIYVIESDAAAHVNPAGAVARVTLRSGIVLAAQHIVLSAGAWAPAIEGLPRALPVFPLKGQMLALVSTALSHPVMGEDVYLVPRAGEIAVGATVERAGFDLTTHDDAIDGLRAAAASVMPSLASAGEARRWAGLRPATPDMLPILGPDPDYPRLLYACGHSKNGILLAPATAQVLASYAGGTARDWDVADFEVSRFQSL
jgi:glycine oxidase